MIRLNIFRLSFFLLLAWICPISAQPLTIELLPSKNPSSLLLRFPGLSLENPDHALLLATASGFDGSALVPFQKSKTPKPRGSYFIFHLILCVSINCLNDNQVSQIPTALCYSASHICPIALMYLCVAFFLYVGMATLATYSVNNFFITS